MSDTYTTTYTAADVVKVADRFGADLTMLAQSSGAMEQARAVDLIADVKEMARKGYLERVSVLLTDAQGEEIRARRYEVSTDASLWSSDRPGGNLWPSTPGGDLNVVVSWNDAWSGLSDEQKAAFKSELKLPWSKSQVDTDFPGMTGRFGRRYASNAYGLERTDFE